MLAPSKISKKQPVFKVPKGKSVKKNPATSTSSSSKGPCLASSAGSSGFSGFSGGDVLTATRRVRDGEDSDEEWDDLSEDELKADPSWSPAGRYSASCGIMKQCTRSCQVLGINKARGFIAHHNLVSLFYFNNLLDQTRSANHNTC